MTAIREHLRGMGILAESLDDITLTVDTDDQLVGAVVQVEHFDPLVHIPRPAPVQPVAASPGPGAMPAQPREAVYSKADAEKDAEDIQSLVRQSEGLALDLGNRVTVEPLLGMEDGRR